jgi:hypothetical protein
MHRYEYLIYSLIFLIAFIVLLLCRRDLAKSVVFACALGAFIGPLSEVLYYRDYWKPLTVLGRAVPSIEDVIFGIAVIGMSLLIYPVVFRKSLQPTGKKSSRRKGGLVLVTVAVAIIIVNLLLGINSVIATSIVCAIALVPMLNKRRDLIKPALWTGTMMAGFASVLYFVALGYIFTDSLKDAWLLNGKLLGILIFGSIPLTELIWFFPAAAFLLTYHMTVRALKFENHS